MPDRPHLPRRKSPRLPGYDYSQDNAYLVTIGVDQMEHRFGFVVDGGIQLNHAGRMVAEKWLNVPERFVSVELDEFVVMPNHFHGIIFIGTDPNLDPPTLSRVMQAFKSETAMEYTRGVHAGLYPRYTRALWLRSFHDKILSNELALSGARAYVMDNPRKWHEAHKRRDS